MVRVRRSTSIVEDLLSVGIRPTAPFPRHRHNLQHPDGRKGASEQATPKYGSTTGEKASSSKQRRNTELRREKRRLQTSNAETRTKGTGLRGKYE
ncbi:hypothetical protein AVEN_186681-1 [Araneus ventricosus]|uniref:Uncharacterized protein n=1 Tax=Araneus ventricosus TaxID=182803 RepID=A0A4Y2G8L6_ARAVE|nr:hypothetical protein AVEN_186681-1 [Araneus ventricosus]